MNIFFNISHPAHVHLFKYTILQLMARGHHVTVVSRQKEFTSQLLNKYSIPHTILTQKGTGFTGLAKEFLSQQMKILKMIHNQSIDLMVQMNGIFNAPVGKVTGIPTLAFSDTENDRWANWVSFSLSKHVFFPTCFDHQVGGNWKNQIHYPGYHELAYLSPHYIKEPINHQQMFIVRFVGWAAGHDIGEKGLCDKQKIDIVSILSHYGKVYISSESPIPDSLSQYTYSFHPSKMHDLMKQCKMIVGESATMTSEAACLGIPAIFISNTGRGYTTEQENKYGLIKHFRLTEWQEMLQQMKKWASRDLQKEWQEKRWRMLADKIEVTQWMIDLIDNYPKSLDMIHDNGFKPYLIVK
jgi:hypothetical protein